MPELDLAVDTQLIMIGQKMSHIKDPPPEYERLLSYFDDYFFLALDEEGHVKAEYDKKMPASTHGHYWLIHLAKNDRIRFHSLAKMERKLRVALEAAHFDKDDYKFVRLAMATDSKILVAEEDDYSRQVRKALKKDAGLNLHSAQSACELVTTIDESEGNGGTTE